MKTKSKTKYNSVKNIKVVPAKNLDKPPLIKDGDGIFICGKTGSGKSVLANELLNDVERLLLIDSKNSNSDWNTENDSVLARAKFRNNKPVRLRVVEDKPALELLEIAYLIGNCTVYIDEINAIIPPGKRPEKIFVDIWQRGRSKGITRWAGTQRPVSVPLFFISEVDHYFMFKLNLLDDRKRVAQFAGNEVLEPIKDPYGFYYYNIHNDKAIYYKRLIV